MTELLDTLIFKNTLSNHSPEPLPFEVQCIESDDQALGYFHQNGATTLEHAFTLANILHRNRKPLEAACIYGLAFRIRSVSSEQYPLPESLMQVRLLCLLKAGKELPEHDMMQLKNLFLPYANYIEGILCSWRGGDKKKSLIHIGNAFEEFVSGEEIDWLYLEIAKSIRPCLFNSISEDLDFNVKIPRKVFMYWDKNPPNEIIENIDFHKNINDIEFEMFNYEKSCEWLYSYYGIEARDLFISMRHPAESADFLRVHVTNVYGGWWLDADARLRDEQTLQFILTQKNDVVLFLTKNFVTHNDFYGTIAHSEVMEECLRILYNNCYKRHHLYIAYKTGPGIFNRALSRIAYRSLNKINSKETIGIFNQDIFEKLIEQIDAPYKEILPLWQNTL